MRNQTYSTDEESVQMKSSLNSLNSTPQKSYKTEDLSWPLTTYFILFVEFCERFCYYGLRSVLVLFFQDFFGIQEDKASQYYHFFGALVYGFPIIGAIISDSFLGRYNTIKYLSLVYFTGILLLAISSIPTIFMFESETRDYHRMGTAVAIILIAAGSGGIKPCVSAFGADQFDKSQEKAKNSFFSWFYFMINVGAVISAYLTPVLKKSDCYADFSESDPEIVEFFTNKDMRLSFDSCHFRSFFVPAMLMLLAIFTFILPSILTYFYFKNASLPTFEKENPTGLADISTKKYKFQYNIVNPDKKSRFVIVNILFAIFSSIVGVIFRHKNENCVDASEEGFLNRSYVQSAKIRRTAYRVAQIMLIFAPCCIFYAIFEQLGSLWLFQAKELSGWLLPNSYWMPDQMEIWNNFFVIMFIPLWNFVCLPMLNKCVFTPDSRLERNKPFILMGSGLVIAGLSNLYASWLQNQIDNSLDFSDDALKYKIVDFSSKNAKTGPATQIFDFQNFTHYESHLGQDLSQYKITEANMKDHFPAVHVLYGGENEASPAQHVRINAKLVNPQKGGQLRVFDLTLGEIAVFDKSDFTGPCLEKFGYVNSALFAVDFENQCHLILEGRRLSMLYQIPNYAITTFAEILIATTGLEFAYTQAPASVKTLTTGLWHLTTCMGNVFCLLLKELKFLTRCQQMMASGFIAFLAAIVFAVIASNFDIKDHVGIDHLDREDSDDQNLNGSNSSSEDPEHQVKSRLLSESYISTQTPPSVSEAGGMDSQMILLPKRNQT